MSTESMYQKEFERFTKKVQAKIRTLRQEHELSQEDMLDYELALRTVQRIEDSKNPANLTILTLFKLAKALKVKPYELLNV